MVSGLGEMRSGKTNHPKNETGSPAEDVMIQPDIGIANINP